MDVKNIISVQNKIEIVIKDNTAKDQYKQIKILVQGTYAFTSPIISISAQ